MRRADLGKLKVIHRGTNGTCLPFLTTTVRRQENNAKLCFLLLCLNVPIALSARGENKNFLLKMHMEPVHIKVKYFKGLMYCVCVRMCWAVSFYGVVAKRPMMSTILFGCAQKTSVTPNDWSAKAPPPQSCTYTCTSLEVNFTTLLCKQPEVFTSEWVIVMYMQAQIRSQFPITVKQPMKSLQKPVSRRVTQSQSFLWRLL